MMRDRVLAWLADNVPPSRRRHILGVEQTAVELARAHNLDVEKAATAGLMHDLAKHFQPQRLLQMALAEGLELDPVLEASPHLLHADVSATVARDEFGVCDREVLQAIRNHTLGQPGMSKLSCAVFLADSLEPGRGNTPELAELRQVSRLDLYQAVGRSLRLFARIYAKKSSTHSPANDTDAKLGNANARAEREIVGEC